MKINEHVAIITGSTKGIGYSIARALVEKGAGVVINGRNETKVEQTIRELQSMGGRVIGLAGAVENPETGKQLVELARKEFGMVNILVNNAGIIHDKMAHKMKEAEFSDVIDVHVKGAFYCTKPFIQHAKQQGTGGFIFNMTSDSGLAGNMGQINYSAAKSAINGMTWTLAKELIRDEIIVNAIAPAALTEMTRPYVERAKQRAAEKGVPMSPSWEIGSSDEVASFIICLIEEKNLEETGAIFGVNGQNVVRWKPPFSEPYQKNVVYSEHGKRG
ncbi:SDR family NAD(P)-dependent oxidoreductase [Neobacillus drentensis]|uniref:SDR family NAD(P)-dependent oxidoreductase n=1 Tax=Neobacillus drentensis TaxID=220684 RepID=UPI000826F383|nr:SDR family NAD(P)-dependent oxidoreductase [Neobacillus drentensis]